MESNFYTAIEAEFSRARGKSSLLSPIDWHLVETWEAKEIPLSIILRAMDDVTKNFKAQNRISSIKTLRYFAEEVEKQFADWCKNQIGKNTEVNDMKNQSFAEAIAYSDDHAKYIEDNLLVHFDLRRFDRYEIKLSEPLCCAIPKVRAELLLLIEEINSKQPGIDFVENHLKSIAAELETALVASFPQEKLSELIEEIKTGFGRMSPTNQVVEKILIRKLHQKFRLPELTLFAL